MNAFEKRVYALFTILIVLAGGTWVYSQTPPGPNTIQHGEGANYPTITATDGYFYGADNITDQLYGDFGVLDITGGDILGTSLTTAGNVAGGAYYIGATNVTDHLTSSLQEANSYTVFTVGGNYHAKNSGTGQTEFLGADAATVIQDCHDVLTNGGVIKIKGGGTTYYDLYSTLNITNLDITIEGESQYAPVIRNLQVGGQNTFTVTTSRFTLKNIRIDGTANTGDGVNVVYPGAGFYYHIKLINVLIYNHGGHGVYCEKVWDLEINGCDVNANDKWGVALKSCGVNCRIYNSFIRSNTLGGLYAGYDNTAGPEPLTLMGNAWLSNQVWLRNTLPFSIISDQFENLPAGNILRLSDSKDGVISACYFSGTINEGIAIVGSTANIQILPNKYAVGVTTKITFVAWTGTNVRIFDPASNYVIENIGAATILNGTTSIIINHGLTYTPTSGNTAWTLSYLENPTNDPGSWYIDTMTATQATIHVFRDPGVSNLDVAWSARRTP